MLVILELVGLCIVGVVVCGCLLVLGWFIGFCWVGDLCVWVVFLCDLGAYFTGCVELRMGGVVLIAVTGAFDFLVLGCRGV